jgi:hypothetical protein
MNDWAHLDWAHIAESLIPILVCTVIFGAPALYLWIVRQARFRTRELELTHDTRIAELQRERDVLEAKVTAMEPELEFLRQLVRTEGVRARIATLPHLPHSEAPPESEEVALAPEQPLHARTQTR